MLELGLGFVCDCPEGAAAAALPLSDPLPLPTETQAQPQVSLANMMLNTEPLEGPESGECGGIAGLSQCH